jgi:hypothetical protein
MNKKFPGTFLCAEMVFLKRIGIDSQKRTKGKRRVVWLG